MGEQGETVSLRITLRYASVAELVERFGDNVSSAGLFLRTPEPKPAGTKIRFELLLADGRRALRGDGVVAGVREDVPGMVIRFGALEPASRELVDRIIERHGQGRLAPTPLSTVFSSSSAGPSGPRAPWRAAGWTPAGPRPGRTALSRSALSRLGTPARDDAGATPPEGQEAPTEVTEALEAEIDPIALAGAPVPSIDEVTADAPEIPMGRVLGEAEKPADLDAVETVETADATLKDLEAVEVTVDADGAPHEPPADVAEEADEATADAGMAARERAAGRAEPMEAVGRAAATMETSGAAADDAEDPAESIEAAEAPTVDPEEAAEPVTDGNEAPAEAAPPDEAATTDAPAPPDDAPARHARPGDEAPPDGAAAPDPDEATEELADEIPASKSSQEEDTAKMRPPRPAALASEVPLPDLSAPEADDLRAPEPPSSPPAVKRADSGDLRLETRPASDPRPEERPASFARTTGPRTAVALELGYDWVRLATLETAELGLIPLEGGSPQLAGFVAVEGDGRLVLGSRARRIATRAPERAVSVLELLQALARDGEDDLDGRFLRDDGEGFALNLGRFRFDASDVLVTFVRALVRSYREHLGHDHVRLIVSVPAQTEDAALAALRGALREAEVEAFRLEPDPQVVFRAYSLEDRSVDTALCVDVEPQALTLTLAQKSPHGLRSVEVHRSPLSSARAFDQRVAELGLEALAADGGPDLRGEAEALASVRTAVENARPDFRRNPTVDVRAELPHPNGERSEHTIHISRSDVEEGSEDLVAAVCREVQTLLQRHELSPADVDAVVCAGSTGRYPHLVTALGGLVGAEPLNSYPANQVKLYGLLKEARALERRARNVVAPGTLVASIGVELPGGRFRPLVHAGTELPTSLERSLPPPRDGGSDVELVLYQGEGELARLCTHLGHLRLDRLPRRAPPALQLQLDVDADGVLTAQMRETQSRRNARLRVATQQTSAERRRALAPTPTSAAEPRKGLLSRWFGG